MGRKKRKTYSKEFKREAVKLILEKGYTISEASRNLGIEYSILRRWTVKVEQEGNDAFPGKGNLKPDDDELRRLKRQLDRVTEERDILKKALVYFAEEKK